MEQQKNNSLPLFWRSVGAGLGYLGLYFGMQMLVCVPFVLVAAFRVIQQQGLQDSQTLINAIILYVQQHNLLLTLSVNVATLAVILVIFLIRKKNPLKEIGLNKVSPKSLLPLIPLGILLNVFTSSLLAMLPPQWLESYEAASQMVLGNSLDIIAVLMVAAIAPLTEEVLFRGLIYTRFSRGLPRWLAVTLCGLLFGLMHGQLVWVIYAGIFGAVLCLTMEQYGSLWGSIVLHMAFNMGSFFMAMLGQVNLLLVMMGSGLACWALAAYIRLHVNRKAMEQEGTG